MRNLEFLNQIFILRGEEASGKTSVFKQLQKRGIIAPEQIVIKDEIAANLGYSSDTPYTSEVRKALYREFFKHALTVIRQQQRVFLEAPFSDEKTISRTFDFFSEKLGEKFFATMITLVADFAIRQSRARQRKCSGFSRNEIDDRVPFEREIRISTREKIFLAMPNILIDTSELNVSEVVDRIFAELAICVGMPELTRPFVRN